mmetsp:Transcript_28077/g.78524  ORF Transcript_28077/g.78524 Transcript_28077/m.78524 type:complete len:277 (+) Transcript_28077:754-1584(+)
MMLSSLFLWLILLSSALHFVRNACTASTVLPNSPAAAAPPASMLSIGLLIRGIFAAAAATVSACSCGARSRSCWDRAWSFCSAVTMLPLYPAILSCSTVDRVEDAGAVHCSRNASRISWSSPSSAFSSSSMPASRSFVVCRVWMRDCSMPSRKRYPAISSRDSSRDLRGSGTATGWEPPPGPPSTACSSSGSSSSRSLSMSSSAQACSLAFSSPVRVSTISVYLDRALAVESGTSPQNRAPVSASLEGSRSAGGTAFTSAAPAAWGNESWAGTRTR